jgi:plastocyanin
LPEKLIPAFQEKRNSITKRQGGENIMTTRGSIIRGAGTLAMLILFCMSLVGCGGGGGSSDGGGTATLVQLVTCPSGTGSTQNESIQDFSFTPSNTPITVNSIVKWTNETNLTTPTTHTVTSTTVPTNGSFNSGNLTAGSSVCYQFTAAGTYHYECSIHTQMTGTVVVQ